MDITLNNVDMYAIERKTMGHVFSDEKQIYAKANTIANNCTNADSVNEVKRTSKGLVSSSAFSSNFSIISLLSEYSIANAAIIKPNKEEKIEIK